MSAAITRIVPYLIARDAKAAIAFYSEAFGAEECFRLVDPVDGRIGHAELKIGASMFMLADEYPDFGALCPDTIGGTPVTFHLASTSVDEDLARVLAAGATLLRPASDQGFGERVAVVLDPFGHKWQLSQTIEQVAPEEMQRRWNESTTA